MRLRIQRGVPIMSCQSSSRMVLLTLGLAAAIASCAVDAENTGVDSHEVVADEGVAVIRQAQVCGNITWNSRLYATANLNLRSSAPSGSILKVMAQNSMVQVVQAAPTTDGWYKVNSNGTVGWASGAFLTL